MALTRETIIRFPIPLTASAVVNENMFFAECTRRRLATRIHLSPDHKTLTLFYTQPLLANARIRVTLVGDGLLTEKGNFVDADGDGQPGGIPHNDTTIRATTIFFVRLMILSSFFGFCERYGLCRMHPVPPMPRSPCGGVLAHGPSLLVLPPS